MKRAGWVLGAAIVALAACGGGGGGGDGGVGSCTPTLSATIVLTASGIAPRAVCVLPGGSVTFVNNDSVQHDIAPDAGCPALSLGPIAPAQSKTATFATEEICQFHDATNATNAAFQGTVAVTTAPATGPGY